MARLVTETTKISPEEAARLRRLADDPAVVNLPEFVSVGDATRSSVIRVALRRGLREMEAELLAMKGSYTTEAELERTPASAG